MKYYMSLGILISALLVLFIVLQIDYSQLMISLRSANFPYLILAVILFVFTLLIRSLRWRYLLTSIKKITTYNLFSAISIGSLGDMALPRSGDFVRAYVIGTKEKVSKVGSLATIVVERTIDVVSVLTILVIILIFYRTSDMSADQIGYLRAGGYFFACICFSIMSVLMLLRFWPVKAIRFLKTIFKFLPDRYLERVVQTAESFITGLQTIKRGRHLIPIILLSFLLWNAYAVINFAILRSFGLILPYYSSFYLILFQVIGVSIPSSPGFIGTYHASVVAGFTVFQVSPELALSVAIIMHIVIFSPCFVLGCIFLLREKMTFKKLLHIGAMRKQE